MSDLPISACVIHDRSEGHEECEANSRCREQKFHLILSHQVEGNPLLLTYGVPKTT